MRLEEFSSSILLFYFIDKGASSKCELQPHHNRYSVQRSRFLQECCVKQIVSIIMRRMQKMAHKSHVCVHTAKDLYLCESIWCNEVCRGISGLEKWQSHPAEA